MKILLINKYFYGRGGAECAFFEQSSLLERNGHRVIHFSMQHPRNHPSPYAPYFVSRVEFEETKSWREKTKAATRILFSREAQRKLTALVKTERPDLAHLHNIHHQISPSILPVLKHARIPIVMTLHDYKILCPVYTLYRDGAICEECLGGRFIRCLAHKCAKGSYLKSGLLSFEMYLHREILRSYELVDCFTCPSHFLKRKMAGAIENDKLFVVPNFAAGPAPHSGPSGDEKTIVYFGRLSPEKGLRTLLQALRGLDARCWIIGEGPERLPLEQYLRREAMENVTLMGYKPPEELPALIQQALFTVLPSEWHENRPRSVLESFSLARTVVASRIGGIPELVKDQETGLTFEAGNAIDLREKMQSLMKNPPLARALGRNAQRFVQEDWTPEIYYRALMEIYTIARERQP